ncbi:Cof-type HAD-IIB family hydrolase [Lacticaseibacillus zeae]|uniref:Cof-type HAD-IIB family hydrolase n=1 Tax=Lacticaseibacillus zeae subsp. silagei TaxID=3068307 RepID=A0ABD7ZBF5_LACZE|nr:MULTISPECIES: Cof-type HAD-IIB family hydrolase [Lacticaseibacillus]MDE3314434.1 Cof-type HAD-IIB family hydrolase [Lacticaseibacillus zeae]OFR98966.1 hydrolase [Lactobacillus sp. HMSC068F07]WLV84062.1 Cof-type HAD-IIB family hydrolase [Lacticaseibacillus sp. NCIMB 15475]WLV86817.1 Cof-type HAD-IIB family hydrolase [Lacticaseibacillus sp. NCIMB 15474]
MFRLIAVDLDDTLLDSHKQLSSATIRGLKAAQAKGIKIVPCTGRPLPGVRTTLDALGLHGDDQYVIVQGGGVVQSTNGKIIAQKFLNHQDYQDFSTFATHVSAAGIDSNVITPAGDVYTADRNISKYTVLQAWENHAGIKVREPQEMPDDFVIAKGLLLGEPENLAKIQPQAEAEFGNRFTVIRSMPFMLEVMPRGVNKGWGLAQLTQYLGLHSDNVIAFGDEHNDLDMFDFAGTSVAVANGQDVVKDQADYITASNDEDGVVQALKHFKII